MIRVPIERVIPVDLINQGKIAAASAAQGDRQNLVKFLDSLNPDDLELLTSPLETRFNADSFGIDSNTWFTVREYTPMAILRGIAEEDKNKPQTNP